MKGTRGGPGSRGGEASARKASQAIPLTEEVKVKRLKDLDPINLCCLYGTQAGAYVNIDTQMVKDLLDHISLKMHKKLQFVEFPSILY